MPIAVTLPNVVASPGDTIVGQKSYFAFLQGAGPQKNFFLKSASFSQSAEKLARDTILADGTVGPDRQVVTKVTKTVKVVVDEFTTDILTFINSPQQVGSGRLWVKDPDDAANTAALLSNEFTCTVTVDGEISFSREAFSEVTLNIDITSAFTLTRDGSTTV